MYFDNPRFVIIECPLYELTTHTTIMSNCDEFAHTECEHVNILNIKFSLLACKLKSITLN